MRRCYTQNIDTLESVAGIPRELTVEAHGSFATATCMTCKKSFDKEYVASKIFSMPAGAAVGDAVIPRCDAPGCDGIVKPDIVFFRGTC